MPEKCNSISIRSAELTHQKELSIIISAIIHPNKSGWWVSEQLRWGMNYWSISNQT